MHIHVSGICGTFMGGLAVLARQLGHTVTGSDQNVYPPMSTQLQEQGIELMSGYHADNLKPEPDLVVIGNAMSRGNPEVEAVLNRGLRYTSGAQWLSEQVLQGRWVLAVAGTHGKTTTSSLIAWVLEAAGLQPGFLIGGIPQNFSLSARLGNAPFFVVEADEYDTAFFDKRSKFVHYRPNAVVLNNLEYDHADIFPDLAAIQTQFHHLVRTVPGLGLIIAPADDSALQAVLSQGCWTPVARTGVQGSDSSLDTDAVEWQAHLQSADGSCFDVLHQGQIQGTVRWALTGLHNVRNALSAIAATHYAGVPVAQAVTALSGFQGVKRRMEIKARIDGITLYDDFAHHPTAIALTLQGLRKQVGSARVIAILEPRSNTMRMGVHKDTLANSLRDADRVLIYQPEDLDWDLNRAIECLSRVCVYTDLDAIVEQLRSETQPGDHLVFMSNGGFGGIHARVEAALNVR